MQSQPQPTTVPPSSVLALTGHRPAGLSFPGKPYNYDTWHLIAALVRAQFSQLRPSTVISGLALGFDTIGAEIAVEMGIPLICAIPYPGQTNKFTATERAVWSNLQKEAVKVKYVGFSYSHDVFHARDRWMVEQAQAVLSLCHGQNSGTKYTMQYAQSRGLPVYNIWAEFQHQSGI